MKIPVPFVVALLSTLITLPGCQGCQGDREIVHEPGGAYGDGSGPSRSGSSSSAVSVERNGRDSGSGGVASNLPRPRTAVKNRDWSKHATYMESRGIFIEMRLDAHPNDAGDKFDLLDVGGCLQNQATIAVVEEKERWNVYKLVESYADGTKQTYFVADPPERIVDCPECTRSVSPDEISGCPREAVGARRKELSLRDYPVRIDWQVQPSPEGGVGLSWREDPAKGGVIMTDGTTLGSKLQGAVTIVPLCDQELRRLLDTDSSSFVAVVRAIPVRNKWPSGKVADSQYVFTRMPITIERVQHQLEKLNNSAVPQVSP